MSRYKLFALVLAVSLGGMFVMAPKTDAISNTFLNVNPVPSGNGTGGSNASMVVEYADAVSVPNINFKWFVPDAYGAWPDITLADFCAPGRSEAYMQVSLFQPDGSWSLFPLRYANYNAPWPDINFCSGNDLFVPGFARWNFVNQTDPPFGATGPDRYTGFDVMLVSVHLRNQATFGGINKFNVVVSNGTFISHAELPESLAAASGVPAGGGFAILGNYPGSGNSYGYNASFTFRPSCAYFELYDVDGNPNQEPAYLHWRDADGWASYGWQTSWQLIRMDTGAVVAQRGPEAFIGNGGAALGGASNQHLSAQVPLLKNVNYEWRWNNINHVNTIHLWMSFSEININTPPCPPSVATCQILSITPGTITPGGSYTVTIRAFNQGSTTWVPGQWNLGSRQGQTNNHVTNSGAIEIRATWGAGGNVPPGGSRDFTYVGTAPGAAGTYPTGWKMVQEGVAWRGTACEANFTVITPITITGTVYNAYNMGTRYNNLPLDTCTGAAVTWNGSGQFSFTIPQGTAFCIRIQGGLPANANARLRPWAEGYWVCPGYGGATVPNYCASAAAYECQAAGVNVGVVNCGGTIADFDRVADSGYDFAVRIPPTIDCSNVSASPTEVNASFTITLRIDHISGSNTPDSAGTVTATVNGIPASSPYSVSRGSFTPVTITHPGVATPNTYTISVSASGSGDGMANVPNPEVCPTSTVAVGTFSYIKIFGGETHAGGGFTNTGSCSPATGGAINTFAETRGADFAGSSAQFSVTALLNVNQLFSASQRTGTNTLPAKGLTFANTVGDPTYGGAFGAARCITDYYGRTKDPTITVGNSVPGSILDGSGRQQYDLGVANVNLPAMTIPRGAQVALFAEGDVFISGDITYNTSGRSNPAEIPYLVIVAKGDIRISSNVSRIDALLIAQARDNGTKGVVKTCVSPANTDYTAATVYAGCSVRQLSINGGIIARDIKLQRVRGTLDQAVVRETPNFNTGAGTAAGEVINYTPEMWLAPNPLKNAAVQPGTGESGNVLRNYDSFRILPPIY